MMVRMVSNNVPLCDHPFDQIRAGLNIISDHKERGFHIVLF